MDKEKISLSDKLFLIIEEVLKDSQLYEKNNKPCVIISYASFRKLTDALEMKEKNNG